MSRSPLRTTTLVLLLLCLIWMDACLYFRIQSIDEHVRHDDTNNTSLTPNDGLRQQQQYPNEELSLDSNANLTQSHAGFGGRTVLPLMDKFSFAFHGMSVKLMMTDPMDNYLLAPLSEAFADMIDFKNNLSFITANMVSYAGVISAIIAAKLVTYDSLTLHRLSYVMFQLRTWFDDLDGAVARSRLGIHKHVSLQKTSGYVVDGVCDAIGFVAYLIGCYIYLENAIKQMRLHRRPGNRCNLKSITEFGSTSCADYIPLQYGGANVGKRGLISKDNEDFNCSNEDDYEDDEEEEILHDALDQVHIHHRDRRLDRAVEYDTKSPTDASCDARRGPPPNDDDDDDDNDKAGACFGLNSPKKPRSRIFMGKMRTNGRHHLIFYRCMQEKIKNNLSNRRLVLLILCFLLQLAMCATFWNRYILVYQDLLESPSTSDHRHKAKRKILKSNIMYIIIWFWRLTNGHSFMQMLITSVFMGKLWQFLDFIKYIGFIEIIILATITELHIIDVRNYLNIL